MHLNYVPKAVRAGAEIRTQARAVEIETDAAGKITGIVYIQDGQAKRQEADVYVLSAFCIETPRLMLHSANGRFSDGLANSSGTVGRYLLAHIADSHFGRFADPVHMWSTAPGTLISQEHYGTKEGRGFVGGWTWMTANLYPGEFAITLAKSGDGFWGRKLMNYLEAYPNFVVLGMEGECLPYDDNRVELSDEKDVFGVPRPKVTFNYGSNERAMRDEIHRIGTRILEAAGAQEVLVSEGNDHTMGGCRMGNDPTTSVVDRNLKTHDHPNLFICDASVFVTPGGVQPSQTIMALATRLAEHLTGKPAARSARERRRVAV